jgi:hypothetical protein
MEVIRKYTHLVSPKAEINLNNYDTYHFQIVYMVNCMINKNYFDWVENQLNLVYHNGAPIHVVACIYPDEQPEFESKLLQKFPNVLLECYAENSYEYRGIYKVWELSQKFSSKQDIILYFHSKGLTHNPSYHHNQNDAYNIILKDFEKIKEIYDIFPQVNKIGYEISSLGFVWYNFWYVRGSYLTHVERPIKTKRRHYYEDWLYRRVKPGKCMLPEVERQIHAYDIPPNNILDCYAFKCDKTKQITNIGTHMNPENGSYIRID